jgi:hypothetical protein
MKGAETVSGTIPAPRSYGPLFDQISSDFVAVKSSDHIQISYLINIPNLVKKNYFAVRECA